MQLRGMTERSKLRKLNFPQNDRNMDGSCTGYSVATFDRICVNVIKILYLVCVFQESNQKIKNVFSTIRKKLYD